MSADKHVSPPQPVISMYETDAVSFTSQLIASLLPLMHAISRWEVVRNQWHYHGEDNHINWAHTSTTEN